MLVNSLSVSQLIERASKSNLVLDLPESDQNVKGANKWEKAIKNSIKRYGWSCSIRIEKDYSKIQISSMRRR